MLPALSACGFSYATDKPNELIHGATGMGDGTRVQGARVVTPTEGEGVLIASFTLNPKVNASDQGENPKLIDVGAAPSAETEVTPTGGVDVQIPDSGIINLADPEVGGIAVTGDFRPGDMVEMTFEFDDGTKPVTLDVPVVKQCGPYADVVAEGGTTIGAEPAEGTSLDNAYACSYPPAELPEH